MIKVAILHEEKAYMPEVEAYHRHLNNHESFEAHIIKEAELDDSYDIAWKLMGFQPRKKVNTVWIHEYNTITVGKNRRVKDFMKRYLNIKPAARVFQRQEIKDAYHFNDDIPYIYRDMGIHERYFQAVADKTYDFVYIGTMDESRQLHKMLKFFKDNPDFTIMMIGTPNPDLVEEFGGLSNVTFTGRIANHLLPDYAAKARYGMNYIPDIYPFNEQTSTKLQEYCALGLGIVTTSYKWVNGFEKEYDAAFFKIEEDMSNLNRTALDNFHFKTPDLSHMEWENLLTEAGVIPFLLRVYEAQS